MRPIIDPDNLVHSEETKVYISRGNIGLTILILVLAVVFILYLLCIKEYLLALFVFLFPCFCIHKIKILVAEWEVVQMKINSQGIQIKNEPIIPWNKIENERIITFVSNEVDDVDYEYFAFYDANSHRPMQFEKNSFNFSPQELLLSAKIHRARFSNSLKNNP